MNAAQHSAAAELSPQELDQVLTRIQKLVQQQSELSASIAEETSRLTELCEGHFRSEEESSLYADLCEKAPWLSQRLQDVLRQHQILRGHLSSLCGCSQRQRPLPRGWLEFSEELAFFRRQLLDHEEIERELWQTAFTTDLGSKD